jgi:tetratricopeptide (TPR) repeat protein
MFILSMSLISKAFAPDSIFGRDRAIPFFQRAADLDPNFAMAYARLGVTYGNMGAMARANENASKAYENHTVQRTVLYLGEINDSQEATWRQTLQVFDEAHQQYTALSLFPEDRGIPAASSDSIQVRPSEMELRRPRAFGNCWLGCELWRQLRLEKFWEEKLAEKVQRETAEFESRFRAR